MGNTKSKVDGEGTPIKRRRSSSLTIMSSRSRSSFREPTALEQIHKTLESNMHRLSNTETITCDEFMELKLSNAECFQALSMPGRSFLECASVFSRFFQLLQTNSQKHLSHTTYLYAALDKIPTLDDFVRSRKQSIRLTLTKIHETVPSHLGDEVVSIIMSVAELYDRFGYHDEMLKVYKEIIAQYLEAMQNTTDEDRQRIYASKALDLGKKISIST